MMFDEVYHGRTAYEFLNDLPIYENTHPPLGKTIISLGIAIFGMNPFGWRFMCAVFGTLMVPVMYLFAWKISHRKDIAFLGTVMFACEFMHFTLSRIATIDIIVAPFIILMFFFMFCFTEEMQNGGRLLNQSIWLLLCGLSTAFAVATKWTGVYAAAGIAIIFFICLKNNLKGKFRESVPYLWKLCGVCVVSFILLPVTVYSISYLEFSQFYTDKNFIQHMISNSVSMLSYHTNAKATHPYESAWYEWLYDKRPLLDSIVISGDKASSVATFGSPVIVWGGLAALVYNLYLWRCRSNKNSRNLVIAYFAMLMPWMFIHRTVFIYQYFVCIILLILIICNSVMNLKKGQRITQIILISCSVVLFVLFYPELSGMMVSKNYIKWLEWLPTWTFV